MKPSIATRYYAKDRTGKDIETIWKAVVDTKCGSCPKTIKTGDLHTLTRAQKKRTFTRVCRECRPFRITSQHSESID